jgi:hypothetical protein
MGRSILHFILYVRNINTKTNKMKPLEYITLALYVVAFKVVDKIGEYKQRKVTNRWKK